jgi:hypothetical protein
MLPKTVSVLRAVTVVKTLVTKKSVPRAEPLGSLIVSACRITGTLYLVL